ncbi:MAG: carbon starvation protein A [Candidatus Margulisiibacteriota bacterium]|jgi:carbon starvation protein
MNSLVLIIVALCIFAIAYRFYGLFIARKILNINPQRIPPSEKLADGKAYVKTNRIMVFGIHFSAIAAAGPLIGPVLAAQFGYLPGALWIIIGCVLAGAVHDMVVLFASIRHKAESLAHIAEKEIGKLTSFVMSIAALIILVLTLAGLSISVVNATYNSPWVSFIIFSTIIIAFIMGIYLKYIRPQDLLGASIIGAILLTLSIYIGPYIVKVPLLNQIFNLSRNKVAILIPLYGFCASILPAWLILYPRIYLTTYIKLGVMAGLAIAIFLIHPVLQMPAITEFATGGGPVISGGIFPFLFITIACGAISGFHSTIATGTTSKILANERDIPFVGYGAMLVEGFVAIMALIAASVLIPADYFAINTPAAAFATLGLTPVHLPQLAKEVHENLMGRTGGGVGLAVGMVYILSKVPIFHKLLAYWYHFIIMFEALFILSAIDAGTIAGRFFLQEFFSKFWPKFLNKKWWPGIILSSFIFSFSWGYLLYTENITTIWPLFGLSNQLLAASGLIIATTMVIRLGKAKFAWLFILPGLFMAFVTFTAGIENIILNYWPQKQYLLIVLSIIIMLLMIFVFIGAFIKWFKLLSFKTLVKDRYNDDVLKLVPE